MAAPVYATTAYVDNSISSPIIASGEFNLKDIGANVLTWASGCSAANTAPTGVVVTLTENDTYAATLNTFATATISIDSGANGYFDAFFDGVQLGLNFNFTGNIADTIAYMVASGGGYVTDLGGNVVRINSLSTTNGKTLTLQGLGAPTTSGATLTSGGIMSETSFYLKQNGDTINFNGGSLNNIPLLDFLSVLTDDFFSNPNKLYTSMVSNSGNWALPVTVGTLNDFRIKIQILGVRIN